MCDPPGVEGVEEAVEKTDPAAETEYKTTKCIYFLQEQTKSWIVPNVSLVPAFV